MQQHHQSSTSAQRQRGAAPSGGWSSSRRGQPVVGGRRPSQRVIACRACRADTSSSSTSTSTSSSTSTSTSSSRRGLVLSAVAAPLLLLGSSSRAAQQRDDAAADALQLYDNTQQQYHLSVPRAWERKDKAGADVLFEDPGRRSTSAGVTVSRVRVASIDQFGDLAAVGQRLLEAERKKESTLGVELLASSSRQGRAGATLYDYEYALDSTRGTKRIFNTVTITGSQLYILNGNYKCDKEAPGCDTPDAAAAIGVLRAIAASFDAGQQP